MKTCLDNGVSPNGKAAGFDPVTLGSSPSTPAYRCRAAIDFN